MSEFENQPSPPPPSTPKTSAVPLKKETVRITLRARPGAGSTQPREATTPVNPVTSGVSSAPPAPRKATAPIQLPSAPLPPPAPKSSTAPVKLPPAPAEVSRRTTTAIPVAAAPPAPPPSVPVPVPPPARPAAAPPPAATVPMSPPRPPTVPGAGAPPVPGSAPRPPGAPTAPRPMAPSGPGGPPRVEVGTTTSPLSKPAPRPPGGAGTSPMAGGSPGTAALPKATVKLQQTQPMARPSVSAPPSAPVKRSAAADSQQFYEEKDPEAGLMPLTVVCLLLSVVLMTVQMFGSDRVSSSPDSFIMVPPPVPVKWELRNADGSWTNNFRSALPQIPQ